MSKVYVGQDLRVTLTGGIDITGGSAKMRYLKSGASNYMEVAAVIQTPASAVCYYDFTPAENNAAGQWRFWLRLTTAAAKVYFGEPFAVTIYAEGE